MDEPKAADSAADGNELSKDFKDLAVNDSQGETQTAKGKKRKNHRGGQKTKHKEGQELSDTATKGPRGEGPAQLYEVRPTASKGLGVFATSDIPRGTRIMCEPPLLYIDNANKPFTHILFDRLSPADQTEFLSLHAYFLKGVKPEIEKILRSFKEADPISFAAPMEEQLNILAVVKSNGCRTNTGVAIPHDQGRINHSCLPNVYHAWNNVINRATVHAVQDIVAGDELLTTYIRAHEPRAQRLSYLWQRWGFQCDCQACDPSSTFGQASETRRQRLSAISKFLVSHNRLSLKGAGARNVKALAAAIEYSELLQEEGIHNMELAIA
ncbi:MAG: hypothetical protein Q9221_000789 [Calogaya cf. arnoldii]